MGRFEAADRRAVKLWASIMEDGCEIAGEDMEVDMLGGEV